MRWILILSFLPVAAKAENCWGQYDPNDHKECEYEFLSEEDKQIDQHIRDNFTAHWVKKRDDRIRQDRHKR